MVILRSYILPYLLASWWSYPRKYGKNRGRWRSMESLCPRNGWFCICISLLFGNNFKFIIGYHIFVWLKSMGAPLILIIVIFFQETQHTIGYGSRQTTNECTSAIIVMSTQSVIGCLIQAFMVGLVFAKLARPQQR